MIFLSRIRAKRGIDEHPCFSHIAHYRFGRVHLPVAPKCNIQCNYCDRVVGDCYHLYRPSVTQKILTAQEALKVVDHYVSYGWFRVAGIAGPGEPLYNKETFQTLRLVHRKYPKLILCLSTNGLLLPEKAKALAELGVRTITVTVNTVKAEIGSKLYSWIEHAGKTYSGVEGSRVLIENQLAGIERASALGLMVKVNTVLIPELNSPSIEAVAELTKERGAEIQNIIPLIPLGRFKKRMAPTCREMKDARKRCEKFLPQFKLCRQCRADSAGIPGRERRWEEHGGAKLNRVEDGLRD